jgi:cytochrome c oxidase subunit 2
VRRRLFALATSLAGALALAAVASASDGGISPVGPVSPNGQRISDAYWLILGITGAIFLIVEGALLTFVIRYRRRGRPRNAEPEQIHGQTSVEIVWTVIPVLILAAIVSFVFYKLPGIKNTPSATAAGDRIHVTVEAHQFYWLFRYAGGRESINVLSVPKDRVVTLDVTSADVAHSWWVPALGGKIDAIPGKTNRTWFKAEKIGTYTIRCAEFCGIQHTAMRGFVRVTAGGRPATERLGKEAFNGVCASCHGFEGEGLIGPAIASSPTLQDPKALRELLRNGSGQMPAVGKTWDDKLISSLSGYLHSRFGGTGGG